MAAAKSEKPAVQEKNPFDGEEYVEMQIPFNGNDTKPVIIGVNGEFIRVRPGETVRVKRKFVEAWQHAKKQERLAWQAQARAQEMSRKALADL